MTTTAPTILATGLSRRFGDTIALDDVSIAIRPGESLAITGTSGSGKSTLLHCLAGIDVPDAGRVVLATRRGPKDVARMRGEQRAELRRTRFGFVFQQGLLIAELTAVENAALPLLLTGRSRRDAERVAAGWLRALGLAGLEDRRLGQLSGGQVQRVAIARAQVTAPDVVFADEPTGALDPTTSLEVMHALRTSVVGNGGSLVVVTHDPVVAAGCHRTVRIDRGRVLSDAVNPGERHR